MRRWSRAMALVAVATLLLAGIGRAASNGDTESVTVMVAFKDGQNAAGELSKNNYDVVYDWSDSANAALVRTTKGNLTKLKALPGVQAVEQENTFHTMGVYNDAFPITWGLQAVKAQEAWNMGARGEDIRVCILDTGIDYNHPEFFRNGKSIIKGSKNFVPDGHPDATDGHGHGTHVAGTVAAQGGTVWGVAPDVKLYVGRVLNDAGSGQSSWILNGVAWCRDTAKAHIISMSLGGSDSSTTEANAYAQAYKKGVLIIAAAGNAGDSSVTYPAGYDSVVSVAAVDSNLNKASFSQFNSDVELAGPGVSVLSSVPRGTGLKTTAQEDGTTYKSGDVAFAGQGSVTGPLVECGLGNTTTSCTGAPTTGAWIALVRRGAITFAAKHNNVQAQGASAMIITNNDTAAPDEPGRFTFGSAGTWLPAVSVSYNSGVTIRAGGLGTGTVKLEPWDYSYFNGTSMATPHVAGVAALVWSVNQSMTNEQVRSILRATATDLGAPSRDVNFGYGLVQADAAVTRAGGGNSQH